MLANDHAYRWINHFSRDAVVILRLQACPGVVTAFWQFLEWPQAPVATLRRWNVAHAQASNRNGRSEPLNVIDNAAHFIMAKPWRPIAVLGGDIIAVDDGGLDRVRVGRVRGHN